MLDLFAATSVVLFQDEKNQILTTNVWLNLVRFINCVAWSRIVQ